VALVELLLPPLPAHVRTARLVVGAAARRAGLPDELVDELRLALGETCGRAVLLHAQHAPEERVQVTVRDDPGGLTVTVRDRHPSGPAAGAQGADVADLLGADEAADDPDERVGGGDIALAVVHGLVDDVSVEPGPDGTTVTMRWPLPARPGGTPSTAASADAARSALPG
jgi:serine/threonine-protein kinase RsbW